jgi:hypothetical protein
MTQMKINPASPYRPFCDVCERDNTSDYIPERDRFECDGCQRDIASQREMEE